MAARAVQGHAEPLAAIRNASPAAGCSLNNLQKNSNLVIPNGVCEVRNPSFPWSCGQEIPRPVGNEAKKKLFPQPAKSGCFRSSLQTEPFPDGLDRPLAKSLPSTLS
jgi:hypothetical protein